MSPLMNASLKHLSKQLLSKLFFDFQNFATKVAADLSAYSPIAVSVIKLLLFVNVQFTNIGKIRS